MGQAQTQANFKPYIHKYLELWRTTSCGSLSFSVFGDWGLGYIQILYGIKEATEALVFEATKPATSYRDTGEVWLPLEVFSLSIRDSKNDSNRSSRTVLLILKNNPQSRQAASLNSCREEGGEEKGKPCCLSYWHGGLPHGGRGTSGKIKELKVPENPCLGPEAKIQKKEKEDF